jgi:hypothetical protein
VVGATTALGKTSKTEHHVRRRVAIHPEKLAHTGIVAEE